MDTRENPTTSFFGESIGFFSPMNGGKTEAMIQELKRARYFDLGSIAYNHSRNTREENAIVVDGKFKYPAVTVDSISALREDLEHRIECLGSQRIGLQGEQGQVNIKGLTHYKKPLKVIGLDEVNLFCLSEQEATDLLGFMQWCRKEEMVLYVAGLLHDFRHMWFGHMDSIYPHVDRKQEKKPACMAIKADGRKCIKTAKHTQRVWSLDFVKEVGMNQLINEMEYFNFSDKGEHEVRREYVAAPFFDETLRIEAEKDGRVKYVPVCLDCARLPYQRETLAVYDAICQGKDPKEILDISLLTEKITSFLSHSFEDWVRKDEESGLYVPTRIHRNILGGFSREARPQNESQ